MAWYYGTYSCGHEGRVNIIGPVKDRQWKADKEFSKMCPECWQKHVEKERERQNEEAAEKAKEMELPELEGSERQVAWANTLRQKLIDRFSKLAEDKAEVNTLNKLYELNVTAEDILKIRDYIITNITSARYYIDNRDEYIAYIIEREKKEALKTEEQIIAEELEKMREEEIKKESTVYPEKRVTDVPVEIKTTNNTIKVYFEKNEDFRQIVKELGYRWNKPCWERELRATNGTIEDRVAELGNKLLNAGFPVMILDKKAREKAISGNFEQEHTRWVDARMDDEYKGWLSIEWQGYNNDLYKTARKLPGSRWNKGVLVKVEYYKEIEDFAELYDFRFSEGATKLIEEHKKSLEDIEEVIPTKVKEKELKDGLKEILNSSTDILDDLKDD
jgi:hypothetical protein